MRILRKIARSSGSQTAQAIPPQDIDTFSKNLPHTVFFSLTENQSTPILHFQIRRIVEAPDEPSRGTSLAVLTTKPARIFSHHNQRVVFASRSFARSNRLAIGFPKSQQPMAGLCRLRTLNQRRFFRAGRGLEISGSFHGSPNLTQKSALATHMTSAAAERKIIGFLRI